MNTNWRKINKMNINQWEDQEEGGSGEGVSGGRGQGGGWIDRSVK